MLCFAGTLLLAVTLVPRDWSQTDIEWIQARTYRSRGKESPIPFGEPAESTWLGGEGVRLHKFFDMK